MPLGKLINVSLHDKWVRQWIFNPLIFLLLTLSTTFVAASPAKKYYYIYSYYLDQYDYVNAPNLSNKKYSSPTAACSALGSILGGISYGRQLEYSYDRTRDVWAGYPNDEDNIYECEYTTVTHYLSPPSPDSYDSHYGGLYFAVRTYYCGDSFLNPTSISSNAITCPDLPPPKNPKVAPGGSCPASSHPITFGYGNKYLPENDYSAMGADPLISSRTYNSASAVSLSNNQGSQWRNMLNRNLWVDGSNIYSYRSDGKVFTFTQSGSNWLPDADITDKLFELKDAGGARTGWTYNNGNTGEIETYDAYGRLLLTSTRAGLTQMFAYSCKTANANCTIITPDSTALISGLPIKVTDSFGRSINLTYDNMNRIARMTNPAGGVYSYAYSTDGSNNLVSVTYPDGKVKTYHYGAETAEAANVSATPNAGVSYANALTGIIDENGSRFATYRYDAAGRAYDEELAPDLGVLAGQAIEHNNLVYNVDGSGNPTSTVVTDAFGSSRTYNFTTILGVVKSTGQSQPAGAGCAASAAALTYDVNGNVASRTDFKGNKTTFVYDLTRNLETSRTEGLTTSNGGTTNVVTAATRTITTTYHPTWRLPLVTTEYSGGTSNLSDGSGTPTGAALRSTTNVYDTKGNITAITEADPLHSLSRTTTVTYTYSTLVSGLVVTKVIDGPRTDVSDVTTYNYYDANVTCTPSSAASLVDPITNTSPANLGCRGQLQSMTDALGHATTYDRYNHHGQVEQMTDANGLVTTNTYDLRQRLLTRSVSGSSIVTQTTSLTYDGVGQVTQLTMPDASTLNYSYDAAHRLTQVQDNLGNKVSYTLDSEGNRSNEVTTDPLNVLTKTLTRSYDALNRLQQVIGVQ